MSQRQQEKPAVSQTTTEPEQTETERPTAVLRLRGAHTSDGRSVQWAEDVVDNEGLGRKSSKGMALLLPQLQFRRITNLRPVCCIYHRPKAVDESSDESSSSDSSGSDSDSEQEGAKPAGGKRQGCGHGHGHEHGRRKARGKKGKEKRAPSPNAYEKLPKVKPKNTEGGTKA